MKQKQLKNLLKHIISEISSQTESHNYDDFNDPSNVANAIYSGLYRAPDFFRKDEDGSEIYTFTLHSPTGPNHAIKKDRNGKWWLLERSNGERKWLPADEYIKAKQSDRAEYKQTGKLSNEMIANKNVEPDVFGAVNVEENYYDKCGDEKCVDEGFFDSDVKTAAKSLFGQIKKITRMSHPSSNSEYFTISFEIPGKEKIIRKDKDGKLWLAKHEGDKLKFVPLVFKQQEQSTSGGAGAYSTPFAFAPTRKKKKHVKENNFLNSVREKIKGSVNTAKKIATEKTTPDGRYIDNMVDPAKEKRATGMSEMTTSGAAGGQAGGTIQVPAWGTKNKLGSKKAIQATKGIGYKVVKSITNEGQ